MMQISKIAPGQTALIFTDLDGTLLDHHNYSATGSAHAIQTLLEHTWPLVFCSSKTFAEQRALQRALGLTQPFIIENGAAVAIPQGYFPNLAGAAMTVDAYEIYPLAHADAAALRSVLGDMEGIRGFADASDDELSTLTGLHGVALDRARDRWFTETLITPLDAGKAGKIMEKLAVNGWSLSRGGRFHTVVSAQADKGLAMRWLADVYARHLPVKPLLVALGDSPNDQHMLAQADVAFLVQRHDGTWADLDLPRAIKIEGIGPAGFSKAIAQLVFGNTFK